MELLQYKYHDAYEFQVSSTDIATSWNKFKVRARKFAPENYCNYGMPTGGYLKVWNCDKRVLECIPESFWGNSRPVFFEDHKYTLSFTFFDAVDEPRIIHPNKEVEAMFNCIKIAKGVYIINSNIDFLNQPGHFTLEVAYTSKIYKKVKHKIEFDVLSPKLDTKQDLDIIIQQIREEYGDLVFRYLTLTFQQFEMGREANNELIWLSVFKQIIDAYLHAVRFVVNRPNSKMQLLEEYKRADRIKVWSPLMAETFINDRIDDNQKALRKYYRAERIESSSDTLENRFVKFTIERIAERLLVLLKKLSSDTSESEIAMLKGKYVELQVLKNNGFFKGIGIFDGFHHHSMVLQQRSGYAQVYRYWIMLQNGLDLIHGDTSVGVQPIWKLYELWCFLKVKRLVCKILGINPKNKDHANKYIHEDIKNAFDLFDGGYLSGHITYINPKNNDYIEIGYQYSFSRDSGKDDMHSVTTEQKPDIVMHIHKHERNITLTYLYDAKYRVKGDGDQGNGNIIDEPVPETLDAMHHYRDAIYYGKYGERKFSKEIIGGFILYPGRMNEQEMLDKINKEDGKLPYFLKSIEEVNIGAYPLLPNEESGLLLENHLHKVILDESINEQLEDSVPQRGLFYTFNEDYAQDLVLVGCIRSEPQSNWILLNGLYNIRLDLGEKHVDGAVKPSKIFMNVSHILLYDDYVSGQEIFVSQYFNIKDSQNSVPVYAGLAQLKKLDYPFNVVYNSPREFKKQVEKVYGDRSYLIYEIDTNPIKFQNNKRVDLKRLIRDKVTDDMPVGSPFVVTMSELKNYLV